MHAWTRLTATVALALAAGAASPAEDAGAALRACRAETDAAARLACYDRAAGGAPPKAGVAPAAKATAPAAVAPAAAAATAPAPAAAKPTAEDNFGREQQIQAEEQQRQQQEARALGELQATVTHIETRMDGLLTMTLDNGQVWRQNSPDSKFRVKEGDRVRIQPGAMKSYILSGPTKKSTRVSRVQ